MESRDRVAQHMRNTTLHRALPTRLLKSPLGLFGRRRPADQRFCSSENVLSDSRYAGVSDRSRPSRSTQPRMLGHPWVAPSGWSPGWPWPLSFRKRWKKYLDRMIHKNYIVSMTRGPDKQFDRDGTLHKAMQLFWNQGYEATGVTDLLSHMAIGRQSMYDTFGNKRALFLEALRAYFAEQWNSVARMLDEPGTAIEKLRHVFESREQMIAEGGHLRLPRWQHRRRAGPPRPRRWPRSSGPSSPK